MPTILRALGVILFVVGLVWIFQGLGVLTAIDSFMIGQRQWVVNGLVALAIGLGFLGLGQMAATRAIRRIVVRDGDVPARRAPRRSVRRREP